MPALHNSAPTQSWKSLEIAIRRDPLAAVLDGQGGEPGMRNKIPHSVRGIAQITKNRPMPRPWLNDPAMRLIEQRLGEAHHFPGPARPDKHPGMGGDPEPDSA